MYFLLKYEKTILEKQFNGYEIKREFVLYQYKLFYSYTDLFLEEIF